MFDLEKLYKNFFEEESFERKKLKRNIKRMELKNRLKDVAPKTKTGRSSRNGKRLQQATDPTINLVNEFNTMYHGPVFVGSDNQKMDVVYDTGSDWLVVEDTACETCYGTNFNTTTSSTFNELSAEEEERLYGSAALKGVRVTDKVCLNADS